MCDKGFLANSDLTRHKKTNAHLMQAQSYVTGSRMSRVDDADRKFPCNVCEKKFKERSHCEKHMRSHTGNENLGTWDGGFEVEVHIFGIHSREN